MDWAEKVVTSLPTEELWNAQGAIYASHARSVGKVGLTELLRAGPVRFVVIKVGERPRWIPEKDCFSFWKSEVKPRVIEPHVSEVFREDFPNEYCYWASEWVGDSGPPIVVLEMNH